MAAGGRVEALLIAGPTASGKSALALALAERLGGAVINADAMQVYADLPILSAQPDPAARTQVPHHLFGTVDGAVPYSLGRWVDEAATAIAAVRAAGRLPIVVGGTGLYFAALTQGLSAIPPVPDDVRRAVRAAADGVPPATLHARLAAVDPLAAGRLRPTDPQRVTRALEVFAATGRSIVSFQSVRQPPALPLAGARAFWLAPDKAVLAASIAARLALMLREGALAEVAALAARGLDPALPVMRALGVPPLLAHLGGAVSLAEATAATLRDTRAYAKRQGTFGRHQLPAFRPIAPDVAAAAILTAIDGR